MRRFLGPLSGVLGQAGLLTIAAGGLPHPANALSINVTYDTSVDSQANAATIKSAFDSVADAFENAITNPITISIKVGWGVANTTPVASGNAGLTLVNAASGFTYSQIRTIMAGTGATLPATNPTTLSTFLIPFAQYKALGLSGLSPSSGFDGYIGFSAAKTFVFDDSNPIPAGQYDFKGVASHEIQHALGRVTGLVGTTALYTYPADIFRYTAPNTSSFSYNTGNTDIHASTDGGATNLGTYADERSGGNRADWQLDLAKQNAQASVIESGEDLCLSVADQRLLMGLGYTFSETASSLFLPGTACAPPGADAAALLAISSPQTPVATPEPATLSITALGLAALAALRRRGRTAPRRPIQAAM
ncbi:MAG: NF038122 family metalloprotease [Acetobacteraceae bacterium]